MLKPNKNKIIKPINHKVNNCKSKSIFQWQKKWKELGKYGIPNENPSKQV